MKRQLISLLPFKKTELYGYSPHSSQIVGWEITKFNIKNYWKHSTGQDVVVGVIDTGCDYNHPDIKNNILEGKNFIYHNNDPMDDNGHGSHVSGTIAAENNGHGMVGVAPDTKIIPIKCLDNNGQVKTPNTIVDGIVWAVERKVDFISMSIGSKYENSEISKAIDYAERSGVIVFCAAGNDGPNEQISFPARYKKTISIGAVDENLNRTNFTCSGEELDFLAPGHNILSLYLNNSYALMSGTSMSNPFAVGCASLLLSYAKKNNLSNKLKTYNDYIDIFKKHTIKLEDPAYSNQKKYEGYGIITPVII